MTERKPRKTLFNPELKRRGIYVLPNLFTTAALFAGFFAIVQAMQGDFARAYNVGTGAPWTIAVQKSAGREPHRGIEP